MTQVAFETQLPVPEAKLQAAMAALYHAAISDAPRADLLQTICVEIAQALAAPLVLLLRKAANGRMVIDAASSQGDLYLAFHRVSECWDGGVAGCGPAGAALKANAPVQMSLNDDGLALWRDAAKAERITDALALPVECDAATCVLEIFTRTPLRAERGGMTIGVLKAGIELLIADIDRIQHERLLARALDAAGNAAFITDHHGTIVWSNPAFSALTSYQAKEVRGRNPSFLQSGKQGVRYYRELWSTIRSGKVWSGETVDRDKAGNLYTIRQTVSPIASDGRVSHYVSIHEDISQLKRDQQALELATGIDRRTGLMTRAAFEAAVRDGLSTLDAGKHSADLLVFSLRGLRRAATSIDADALEFLLDTMGRRMRDSIPAAHPAAATGAYEYAALIRDDRLEGTTVEKLIDDVKNKLGEPVLYLGDLLGVDVHCGRARAPSRGATLEELWSAADRQLADEPVARARPTH